MGTFTLFNDIKRIVRSARLESEGVKTIFGDVKLDLTQAPLEVGEHSMHLLTVFGDIKLRIPEHVGLAINARTLFSELEIESRSSGEEEKPGGAWQSEGFERARVRLYLSIEGLFGDIDIVRVATQGAPVQLRDAYEVYADEPLGYEGATQRLPRDQDR
jgi:predicted membrane protein